MTPTFKLANEAVYLQALRRYAREVPKDLNYVLARTSLNLTIKAAQATRVASVYPIKLLFQKSWWPKFIAKILKKKFPTKTKVKKKYLRVENGNPRHMVATYGRHYSRKQAQKKSVGILRGRVARAKYVKSGWRPAIEALRAEKLRLMVPAGASVKTSFRFTRNKQPGFFRFNRSTWAPSTIIGHTGNTSMTLAKDAMNRAFATAAADMIQFLDSEIKKRIATEEARNR